MKKFWIGLLAGVFVFAAGCSSGETPAGGGEDVNDGVKSYEEIYAGTATEKYSPVTGPTRYRASYGYTDNTEQGYNGWQYLSGDDLAPMTHDGTVWTGSGAEFESGVFKLGGQAALRFVPPLSGAVTVSGTLRMAKEGGHTALKVMMGATQLFPTAGELTVEGNDLTGRYFSFTAELSATPLDFILSGEGEVYLNPTVDFANQPNETLYDVPEWGYYGDLHEYYYNDRVNLYHLRNLGGDQWEWYLDTTTDMFRYKRQTYDATFVKNHYMGYASAPPLVDYALYPDGGRDCTLFYDEDVDLYRYIGLTYRNRATGDCDLSMRTSKANDFYGEWGAAIPLRDFSGSGEPECAAFRKLNDTWYLYCGISGQTVHGVGGFSYWKGAKGATIDETDWLHAETYRLDGEDLAVPQAEEIGGRYYLFGWMPQRYNGGNWGGYKNMPREVYVREDGMLGTRIDEMATKLLNRGRLIDVNAVSASKAGGEMQFGEGAVSMTGTNNRAQIALNANSTFTTFKLDMKDSTRAGYVMRSSGGEEYYAFLVKRGEGTYLQIGCPTDPSHPISSEVYLGSASETVFECKIVTDGVWQNGSRNGTNVEFCVNDRIVLSGRTSLNMEKGYTPEFFADGSANFTEIAINRLAQRYDVYD